MNSVVAKQRLWPNCVIKIFLKQDCFLAKVWASRLCKTYITYILMHLVLKLCKNKNLRCSIKATADAAVKG